MASKPPPDDPRWTLVRDEPEGHIRMQAGAQQTDREFYLQEWQIEERDGTVHRHVEHFVNARARTERPPL